MNNKLYIIRGIPGAGKSTYALQQALGTLATIYEADQFHTNPHTKEYDFNNGYHEYAHSHCLGQVAYQLRWYNDCYVCNTFTKWWEIEKYLRMACALGCDVEIIHSLGEFNNVHNVPSEAIERMRNRFQDNKSIYEKIKEDGDLTNISISLYTYDPASEKKLDKMTYFKRVGAVEEK